jgi:hypothetical protein
MDAVVITSFQFLGTFDPAVRIAGTPERLLNVDLIGSNTNNRA